MASGHYLDFGSSKWTDPVNYIVWASLLYLFMHLTIYELLIGVGLVHEKEKLEVDEDLPNFFNTLTTSMAKIPVDSNRFCQDNFGFEF